MYIDLYVNFSYALYLFAFYYLNFLVIYLHFSFFYYFLLVWFHNVCGEKMCSVILTFSPFSIFCCHFQIQVKFLDFKLAKPNDCETNFLDIFPEQTVMPLR